MVDRGIIRGLLVCAYDKNNRIILPDADYPIRFCGKMLPKVFIVKKRDVHTG